jgi:GntR family transcriptional repressor for pyruvate dehydrogenase complex
VPEGRSAIQPVRRLNVSDAVAAQLARLITQGEYDGDGRLPSERVLAAQFGVGRSSMREALRSLGADGLVRIEHGVGVFVVDAAERAASESPLMANGRYTVPEYFEVRIPLERDAAGLAARRRSPDQVADMDQILAAAADPSISDEQFIDLDARLHRAVFAATNNGLLLDVMNHLEPLFRAYSHHVITLPGRRQTAHAGHVQIVEAIGDRRPREARTAAVEHIRAVEADLAAYLHSADGHKTSGRR